MTTIFRIEHKVGLNGMWYNPEGGFDPLIQRLTDAKARGLPMEYDGEYKAGGENWYSACDSLATMRDWFYTRDVQELMTLNYGLYQFEVSDYRQYGGHVIFTRSSVSTIAPLDLAVLAEPIPT